MLKKLLRILFTACPIFLLASCHKATVDELKQKVVGNWQEVDTKNEFLNFNDDGTVTMQSPTFHETCEYDFPDAEHVRFNCAPQGAPPRYQVWQFAFKGGQLQISDANEVGKYARQEPGK